VSPAQTTYPCPDCDFESITPAGLGSHRKAKHGVNGKTPRAVKAPKAETNGHASVSRALRADRDLAEIVMRLFPKGIPTKDVDELAGILREIAGLRARLG
jgi:hypothetical protein